MKSKILLIIMSSSLWVEDEADWAARTEAIVST